MSGLKKTGDRIFIIGNGPTMADVDVSRLQDEHTMVFNDFSHRLHELSPTYWMIFDTEVYRGYKKDIMEQQLKGTRLIVLSDHIKGSERILAYGDCRALRQGKIAFYDKHNGKIFSIGAVGYAGIQWAWQNGYRRFYVMGFDSRDPRPAQHYIEAYCENGKKTRGFSNLPEGIWGMGYDYANKWIWENGGEIWDVSHSESGSFEYKDIDEVLNG